MTRQMSIREQADLTAKLDGITDEESRKATFNRFRTLRDNGSINPDLPPESGRSGAYSAAAVSAARLVFVAYEVARRADVAVFLGRWLAERPVDPSADMPVGETFMPSSRIEDLIARIQSGEDVTLTLELRHPKSGPGLTWGIVVSNPPADTELRKAAKLVRATHEVRASIVLPVSELVLAIIAEIEG